MSGLGNIVAPRGGVVTVSSTTYTWRADANGLTLVFTNAGAITFTVPVGLPIGMTSKVIQQGAGTITFVAGSGASLNSVGSPLTTSAQYAEVTLASVGMDSYVLSGEVSGSGGGGAAIIPETGSSPIKISAFPAAATPMGNTDIVTGLQGGANVKFTQAQILGSPDGAASGDPGGTIFAHLGSGNVTGAGGSQLSYAGNSGAISGPGGSWGWYGGNSAGGSSAGSINLNGGIGYGSNGGGLHVLCGPASGSSYMSGSIYMAPGTISGGASPGYIKFDLTTAAGAQFYIGGLPTADPSLSGGALWADHDVIMQSGVGNYTGATTIAGISTKTLTFSHGILVSIA